jgi:hypothetical protein
MRDIIIRPALNGFIVNVDCQKVVFGSVECLVSELARYLTQPEQTEQRYLQEAVNKLPTGPCIAEDPVANCPPPPRSEFRLGSMEQRSEKQA